MTDKPNIVVIMTDQQRADLRAKEGFEIDTMPFLDSFADKGVDFKRAYTSMPVCGPARVSLFTGRFPTAAHVKTNHNLEDAYYKKDLLDILKEQGYKTALCGKNHSHLSKNDFDFCREFGHDGGKGEDRSLLQKEFDEYLKNLQHMTATEPTPFPLECQGPYRMVNHAQEWIDEINKNGNDPFFLWLSFAEPHNPFQVPEPYFSMFNPDSLPSTLTDKNDLEKKGFKYKWLRDKWEQIIPDFDNVLNRTRTNYMGMLRLIDDQVKRFIKYLEDNGLNEDTVIIFLADHGDFVGEYGLIRKGAGLPEVLTRIPMIMVGPEIISGQKSDDNFVSIVDIMPTICDMLNLDLPAGVQGRSLWPMLTGEQYPRNEFESIYSEHGFGGQYYDEEDDLDPEETGAINNGCTFDELNTWTQSGTMRMVRKGKWKLIFDMNGKGQLYNLEEDPFEINNLFEKDSIKDIRQELMAELLKWILRTEDDLPYPRRRYVMKSHPHNYYKNK